MNKLVMSGVAAVVLLAATPAYAQVGFYAGPGGFGLQVAPSYGYYDGPYGYYRTEPRYYRYGRTWRDRDWRYRDGRYSYGWDGGYYGRPYWRGW